MLRPLQALLAALLASCSSGLDAPLQTQLGAGTIAASAKSRPLKGRFLHITDFHPDPHYKTYSSTKETAACHREHGPAGYYGAETSACDSPVSLVNATLDWIKHHVADDIDFVVWTGDSARHDNDEKRPRTQNEIISQNELMVQKLTDVFGNGEDKEDPTKAFKIPIVPTFGNNDIMPHNILLAGPNRWTMKYLDIWRGFIPEAQRHQFQQGGWFSVEVIPGNLAVISLNTMYFFTSNSAVDGCANKKEPGYEQFEWLRIQLQIMRDRGMSAILIGHVPPARVNSKESWDETCWQKYALWERQYRDVIVGSLFGHMNIDHFMLQDSHHIKRGAKHGQMTPQSTKARARVRGGGLLTDGEITVASASDYLVELRHWWSKLPSPSSKKNKGRSVAEYADEDSDEKDLSIWQETFSVFSKTHKKPQNGKEKSFLEKIGGQYAERYSVSLVAPSVVPNYFPTIRVFEYNITGLEHLTVSPVSEQETFSNSLIQKLAVDHDFADDDTYTRDTASVLKRKHKNKEKGSLKNRKKYKFKVPKGPSKSSPPGPAYSPQTLTFTSYTQYFANLTHINNDFVAETQTQTPNEDSPQTIFGLEVDADGKIEQQGWKEGKHGKHQGKKPHVKPHPKKFKFEVEYDTKTDKRYQLTDLTVRSFVDLARRIGQRAKKGKRGVYEARVDADDGEVDADGGKKKKGKERNKTWLTFVQRAFVGTLDPEEVAAFGSEDSTGGEEEEEEEENMEL
ncbi:Endopolyphosphatase [Karstenula rhodostoma CBS 690.94]|uniref:Endopolyphosphatase n=1 Tax=Karstenula rhodostoma CBS 690.94 TaxID=1392251 RepID=A0A9P4PSI2_9PLEO|nr:Endopolyphosphatase [Karstenula rhodostoma CBS 690.94]